MTYVKEKWNSFVKWYKTDKTRHTFLIILIVFAIYYFITPSKYEASEPKEVSYLEFQEMLEENEVTEVTINFNAPRFQFYDEEENKYITDNPRKEGFKETLLSHEVQVNEIDPTAEQRAYDILRMFLWIGLFAFVFIWLQKRMVPTKTSPTKSAKSIPNTTFDDVAGQDESKEEMKFLVEFLKNPTKFKKMGAKLPKGVILYGPPGTGKTLIAKGIAGEAGVPFFSISGSDFIEMFVGVGAKRVRELFEEARKNAPSIIFIDEIDSIGSNRDHHSNSEQRQTINAILKEMDGFDSKEGVIVIGATNKIEDLDPAFIRPGRFDKHISINLPDQKGRLDIIKIHAKNKPLAPDVDLEALSKMTIGMSGAYLESIMNESAILATSRNREVITNEDIDDAFYKIVMKGHKKKSGDVRKKEEIELVAWHEAGHALVSKLLTNNEVPKVTIIPSTSGAGGVTFTIPKKMGLLSKEELCNEIKVLYAGRVGELLLLGDDQKVTTGASQDIRQATAHIKRYIDDYGMSETYGMLKISSLGDSRLNSLHQNEAFVQEATELSKKLYNETVELLTTHKDALQALSEALIERETLNEEEIEEIIKQYLH